MKFEPIRWTGWPSTSDSNVREISYRHERDLEALFLGRRVTKVADDHLMLDDGTTLLLVGNDGGCSCGSGDYDLTELNECDNIITKVEVSEEGGGGWSDAYEPTRYRLYVYAENQKVNLATFEGDDGSGYYGTGFQIIVRNPE